MRQTIGVGVIGMGWMGMVHSRAYSSITNRFHQSGLKPQLVVCADHVEARTIHAKERLGFATCTTDWRQVIANPDVQLVVVATSNDQHLAIIEAAAAASKHVFCEKPVGRNPHETAAIHKTAQTAGILTAVGYNYRWVPVVRHAHRLIHAGELGEITHYRGRFLVDYGSNPQGVLSWRFQKDIAGYGTLSDLMSHVLDMAHMMVGPIERVVSHNKRFITHRPLANQGEGTHFTVGGNGPKGEVTNEDYVGAMVQFASGIPGSFEVCRVIKGHDCEFAFEIDGTKGALRWSYERMNEIELRLPETGCDYDGFTTVRAGPQHPNFAQFYPGTGNSMGYEDLKLIEAHQFANTIANAKQDQPSFSEALAVAEVQDAIVRSWKSERWENVSELSV